MVTLMTIDIEFIGRETIAIADGHWFGGTPGHVDGEEIQYENDAAVRWSDYQDGNNDFTDAVQSGDPNRPRSPYADALHSFELTLAVNESLETGAAVEITDYV